MRNQRKKELNDAAVDQYVLHVSCDHNDAIGAKPAAPLSLANAFGKDPRNAHGVRCVGNGRSCDLRVAPFGAERRQILPEREILNILRDAAAAHENVPEIDGNADLHNAVAALINRILSGGNSVRRR